MSDPGSTPALEPAERRRLRRLVSGLNALLSEVRVRLPRAEYYLDAHGNLNLMSDDGHDSNGTPRQDRILGSERLN